MIGCLRTRVRKQPIIVLYFDCQNRVSQTEIENRKACKTKIISDDRESFCLLYCSLLYYVCYFAYLCFTFCRINEENFACELSHCILLARTLSTMMLVQECKTPT